MQSNETRQRGPEGATGRDGSDGRRRWRRRGLRVVALALAFRFAVGGAAAHDVGATRFDSPIPLGLLFAGAGLTVALTAVWLARSGDREPGVDRRAHLVTVPDRAAGAARTVARAGFAVLVVLAVVVGLRGPTAPAENVATVFVWPVWIEGLGLLAILVGSPWRVLSPWRALYRGLTAIEGETIALVSYPAWLGVWPAVVGFAVAVGVIENVRIVGIARSPSTTATLVAAYSLAMVVGAVLTGPAWFRNADFFEVLYRLLGRVAPVDTARPGDAGVDSRDGEDGDRGPLAVSLRAPWVGCLAPARASGAVALIVTAVYTVTFDGLTNTPEYQSLLVGARDALGVGRWTGVLLYALGLAGFLASFHLVSLVVERVGRADGALAAADGGAEGASRDPEVESGVDDRPSVARAFAPTVVPIAAAYQVAHNYPYVLNNVARLFEIAAHAGGVRVGIDPLFWLSLPAFWGSQVLLIVAGHLVAVVAAHVVATRRYGSVRRAHRAHAPLVVLMVGYTVLSLWIVSRPVVS